MPRYNLDNKQGIRNAKKNIDYHATKGHIIEQKHIKKTISSVAFRALHLYFKNVADSLLEVGHNYVYKNQITGEMMEIPYTGERFKEWIWKPLQETLFKIESTKKLEPQMIDDILTVLTPWLSNINKLVKFPNRFDLMVEQMNKAEKL